MKINLKEHVKSDTFEALKRCSEFLGFLDFESETVWPHELAGFVEALKTIEDTPDSFPRGKWATIQHLQNLCKKMAEGE